MAHVVTPVFFSITPFMKKNIGVCGVVFFRDVFVVVFNILSNFAAVKTPFAE